VKSSQWALTVGARYDQNLRSFHLEPGSSNQQYPTIPWDIPQFPVIYYNSLGYPTIPCDILQFPGISHNSRDHPTVIFYWHIDFIIFIEYIIINRNAYCISALPSFVVSVSLCSNYDVVYLPQARLPLILRAPKITNQHQQTCSCEIKANSSYAMLIHGLPVLSNGEELYIADHRYNSTADRPLRERNVTLSNGKTVIRLSAESGNFLQGASSVFLTIQAPG